MTVLGIDPGIAITGYAFLQEQGQGINVLDYGAIRTSSKLAIPVRLTEIYDKLEELIDIHKPDVLAIEELFFNKNTKTALKVGQAVGTIVVACARNGLKVKMYTPLQVKQAVVGYGRAEKSQIQQMVTMLLKLDCVPSPDDIADALAVALCHIHSRGIEEKIGVF